MIEAKPGSRFRSTVCSTEVVVVRAAGGELDLRCGGVAMVALDDAAAPSGEPAAGFDAGTAIGKRYVTGDEGTELLCTKPGAGSLSIGEVVLAQKGAKPLPSSD